MEWHLRGKRSLITGGTKGIGLSVVEEFLSLGADVFLVARDEQRLHSLIEKHRKEGKPIDGMAGDLSDGGFRKKIVEALGKKWIGLDVLVNNVGTNIRKKFSDYTEEEYRRLFEINLFSLTEMCRLSFPLLKNSGNASIVNVASVAGSFDVQSGPPYGMTKAAIIQLTRHLAAEWAPFHIRVNCVSPWYIETPLTESVLSQPARLEKILARTPMNRVGQPHEVASAITYFAMDHASYITGQNLLIDGGMSIKGL